MAAQIPIKSDPQANKIAQELVRKDKEREVKAGHDGTWVAHPGLVPIAMEVFNKGMINQNQISNKRNDVKVSSKDLLSIPSCEITEGGLRTNINVGILYLEAWLRGSGCVPLYNLMEDAATAEISRSQVWQWIRHKAKMSNGILISPELVKKTINEELEKIKKIVGDDKYNLGKFKLASKLFEEIVTKTDFPEFLTNIVYEYID